MTDIVERLHNSTEWYHSDSKLKMEAIAEIETLREALRLADAALSGANMNMSVVQRKVRAALGEVK